MTQRTLKQLLAALDGRLPAGGPESRPLSFCDVIASDLMSDVLMEDREQMLLVTSLATEQAVRTAHLIDAAALVLAGGKALPAPAVRLAEELNLTLITSPHSKFKISLALGRLMED
jgi:hypothetical protein